MTKFPPVENEVAAGCSPVEDDGVTSRLVLSVDDRATARMVLLEDNGAASKCSSVEDDKPVAECWSIENDEVAADEGGFGLLSGSKYLVNSGSVESRDGPLSRSDVSFMTRKCLAAKGRKENLWKR